VERETGGERQDGRVRTKILKTIGQQNEARNERQMVGPNERKPTIRLASAQGSTTALWWERDLTKDKLCKYSNTRTVAGQLTRGNFGQ